MRILQRAPQSYPRSACPVPAQRIAHHFPRHRALRLHRESASGCRAAEDFGERHEFAVLDDATRTTAREQSAEVRGLQLYPISRTGQRARGERRSNGRKDVWLGCFSAVGTPHSRLALAVRVARSRGRWLRACTFPRAGSARPAEDRGESGAPRREMALRMRPRPPMPCPRSSWPTTVKADAFLLSARRWHIQASPGRARTRQRERTAAAPAWQRRSASAQLSSENHGSRPGV